MRALGFGLGFIGLIALVFGSMSGCNSLFAWNGRHAVNVVALAEGRSITLLTPEPGRRYTLSVKVLFDRESVELREGTSVVEAKFPLVVRATDVQKTVRAELLGWLDPNEPPNVLYGQTVKDGARAVTELSVERLVGPFVVSNREPITIDVELGQDQVRRARVVERRLVIYDDALPREIRNAFLLAGVGAVASLAGVVLVVIGWLRGRRTTKRKRGGILTTNAV